MNRSILRVVTALFFTGMSIASESEAIHVHDILSELNAHANTILELSGKQAEEIGIYKQDLLRQILAMPEDQPERLNLADQYAFHVLAISSAADQAEQLAIDNAAQIYFHLTLSGPAPKWERPLYPVRFMWSRAASDIVPRIVAAQGGEDVKARVYVFIKNNLILEAIEWEAEHALTGLNPGSSDLSHRIRYLSQLASEMGKVEDLKVFLKRYVRMPGSYIVANGTHDESSKIELIDGFRTAVSHAGLDPNEILE